jgi:hypothetical protein
MAFSPGDDGPECTCGETSVVVSTPEGPMALCFGHTPEAGRIFRLPPEASGDTSLECIEADLKDMRKP